MPLCKPNPTWGGKVRYWNVATRAHPAQTWWKDLKKNDMFALQAHRTGWFLRQLAPC
jgi:hypothetical protein